jgi:hypothetical protein
MKYIFNILIVVLFFAGEVSAQENNDKKSEASDKKKSYEEVITEQAKTDEGLFTVHEVGGRYYYEIPVDLLERDMLLISRYNKIPAGLGGGYLNAGRKTNEGIIRWSKFRNTIHLKTVSYESVADESLPIYASVQDNNYQPVLAVFEIETYGKDSTTVVIEVNDLFTTDVKALSGISPRLKETYKVSNLDKNRSYISSIRSFPNNVEVKHDMTYHAAKPPNNTQAGTLSMRMSQSMYLLPEEPMQARLFDPRVGWFTTSQIDYGSTALKADQKKYIKRWRMIPKDVEAYDRGELVEPIKPIVYYLDPATPEEWRPYFRQGILDWNEAFESAGFKNAVQVKDAPSKVDDPDWSPEDARYSVVRYVASTTRNAMGPSVSDPRSGEIIESDIIWYHNHLRSYRNRYMLETGGANPTARTLNTSEAEIGEMMRRVISHEVGHALGLPHNMKASYAYPTDSLRSATFTQKWGLATTIMDYTRYNYVAQPGDEGVRWVRMLGPYDIYSIDWGYRYISGADSAMAELPTLDRWIKSKNGDPMFLFGARNSFDPSSQTESVGDDAVLASSYGLKNLKIVAANLDEWTQTEGKGFEDLGELFGELLSVWTRYVNHVVTNVGGVYEIIKTAPELGFSYTHVSKNEQVKSMQFLMDEAFTTPTWMLQDDIIRNIGPSGIITKIGDMQYRQLRYLLRSDRLKRIIENKALNGKTAYALSDLFKDLRRGILQVDNPDTYQRNLQRSYVLHLLKLVHDDGGKTDISASARGELQWIQKRGKKAAKRNKLDVQSLHTAELYHMIQEPPVMKKSTDEWLDVEPLDTCCD